MHITNRAAICSMDSPKGLPEKAGVIRTGILLKVENSLKLSPSYVTAKRIRTKPMLRIPVKCCRARNRSDALKKQRADRNHSLRRA